MLRRLAPFVLFLTACGPEDPDVDDSASTEDTLDPTEFVPTTTNDTDGPGTDSSAELCGPCHTILDGNVSPADRTELDGLLVAVDQLRDAVITVQGEFRADIGAIAEVYGVGPIDASPASVADLITTIQADFAANLDVARAHHVASQCSSDLDVAAAAQLRCEANAGCDVVVPAGRPSVKCEGRCEGSCAALCSGDLSCVQPVSGNPCEGLCRGVCSAAAATACAGNCVGACSGACLAIDIDGKCNGPCDGACSGSCELAEATACDGDCSGACLVDQGSAQCLGDGPCHGACDGECDGACVGHITPPSGSPDCEASADCQAQASAQGSANLQCTPPLLDLYFAFRAGVDSNAQAQFIERRRVLFQRGRTILQGAARLRALTDGDVNGEHLWEPSPMVRLAATLQGIISDGLPEDNHIPESRLPCVIPALQAALSALSDTGADATPTLAAQASFAAFITGDF